LNFEKSLVIPAKAGIYCFGFLILVIGAYLKFVILNLVLIIKIIYFITIILDSRLRGNDRKGMGMTVGFQN